MYDNNYSSNVYYHTYHMYTYCVWRLYLYRVVVSIYILQTAGNAQGISHVGIHKTGDVSISSVGIHKTGDVLISHVRIHKTGDVLISSVGIHKTGDVLN